MDVPQFLFVLLTGHVMCTRVYASLANAYVGCYGTDRVVRKNAAYKPTKECWNRCQRVGIDKLLVVGARWCGCGGPMNPAYGHCSLTCRWIEPSICDCYKGDKSYFFAAYDAAVKLVRDLPSPVSNLGYDCKNAGRAYWSELYPKAEYQRTNDCRHKVCIHAGTSHYAFLHTQHCGCLGARKPNGDYIIIPITRDCVDKIICYDLPYSVCLCGKSLIDPSYYRSKAGMGPLLKTSAYKCYSLYLSTDNALRIRKFDFLAVYKPSATPAECINTCHQNHKPYAAIKNWGVCTCQDDNNHRPFTDADCTSTCSKNTRLKVCGGPFTASVFKADPKLLVTTPAPTTARKIVITAPPTTKKPVASVPKTVVEEVKVRQTTENQLTLNTNMREKETEPTEDESEPMEGDIIVENEDDFLIPGDQGARLGMSNEDVMKFGGLGLGVIILAIIIICILCRKGSDSSKKKKKKKKSKDKDRSPEEREARRKRREERKRRKQEKKEKS